MKLLNKKAFFLVETIVVIAIVGVVITFLFKSFSKIYNSYDTGKNYNTVSAINATSYVKKYIDNLGIEYGDLIENNPYLDITNLDEISNDYYDSLKEDSDISKVYLINLSTFFDDESNLNNFNVAERRYLNTLKNKNSVYVLAVRNTSNEFSSISVYNYYVKLVGNSNDEYSTYVLQNTEYVDPGYEAEDSNGNLIDVYITGFVDTSILGEYYLNYNVGKMQVRRRVVVVSPDEYDTEKGVNKPKLIAGMAPVKWNGNEWVYTTHNDPKWYSYGTSTSEKSWANAMTQDGSMWVWIPRYVYKISSGWHSSSTGTIEVEFSMGTDDTRGGTIPFDSGTTSNASNNTWTNHPAFSFESAELTGIWVAKFEATKQDADYTSDPYCTITEDDYLTKTVKVIPNVRAWRCITIGNAFTAIRNMETKKAYGWKLASNLKTDGTFAIDNNGIDTHLMKNSEYGAVAYLSKSKYGQNTNELWINNDQNLTTGCSGNSVSQGENDGCLNTYESTNGMRASTTGTIYGVYDMKGLSWERVSAFVDNGNGALTTSGSSIINAQSKYKDIYTVGSPDNSLNNYELTINKKGDAVYETSNGIGSTSWFGADSDIPYTTNPWFARGGQWSSAGGAGMFSTSYVNGEADDYHGFRPVLVVKEGL